MSISSISGNSTWTQIQQFQAGKTKLQKEDLQKMQEQVAATQTQSQSASPFEALLGAFDEIDKDQDGISIDELKSYASETAGTEGTERRPPKGPPPGPPPSMAGELGQSQAMGKSGGMPESVSKDELLEIQAQMESQGMEVPEKLSDLIAKFDSLDTDQDGKVSIEEMMAGEESESQTSQNSESSVESQKLDFLKLIEKYASEDSADTKATTDNSKDMAIKFMRAINQYSNFASYSKQTDASSMFEAEG